MSAVVDAVAEVAPSKTLTLREYFEFNRQSLEKHEFYKGEVFVMPGGTARHSLIGANVVGEMRQLLKETDCDAYQSDLRINITGTGLYTYPDASVVCGELQFDEADPHGETIINPRVLVEVLSKSTMRYDREIKRRHYQTLDSLQELLLVHQTEPWVEQLVRQPGRGWLLIDTIALDAEVELQSVGVRLAMSEIYRSVKFDPPGDLKGLL